MEIIEAAAGDDHSGMDVEKGLATNYIDSGGAAYVVWENLTVVIPNFGNGPTKRLLNGVHGYAQPGRTTAIMGPSGSGKSTLLDALAGRLSANLIMTGNVFLNGRHRKLDYGVVAYVTQEDVLMGTLTVRETITYSARLRLPSSMTKEEVDQIIDNTIMEMGLLECADQIIGNWHLRGISGGEKKRLSIALEILTKPRLLFLDEPTSGLDSASAFFVLQVLKNVASVGRTIITSIHQPSSEVFALFDDLSLLSGGETIYFGEAKTAVQFFADSGYPCSSRRNPSDHFLRCINIDFDDVNAILMESQRFKDVNATLVESQIFSPSEDIEKSAGASLKFSTGQIRERLLQEYKFSKYGATVRARIQEILSIEGLGIGKRGGSEARWYKQLSTLTKRSFTNMSRDFGYYWLRIIVYIMVSLCVGSVFYDVGTSYSAIVARGGAGGFMSGYMTFMAIGGFPSFIEEMKIFRKERHNGHYGVGVFVVSNLLSSFPFLFVMSLSSVAIAYSLVKFHPGFSRFLYAFLDLLGSISAVESLMMVVASMVPNFLMGLILGAGLIGIMMATAGYFRLLPDLPKPFWRYPISYVNYMAWGLEGAYKNDMIGLEFDSLEPDGLKLEGEFILSAILGISPDFSKWWDLAAVMIISISCRFLFYFILKLREKATPMFRRVYVKRIQQRISRRPSFRKMPPFPSKRHHIAHSLSSQEGLYSPIH